MNHLDKLNFKKKGYIILKNLNLPYTPYKLAKDIYNFIISCNFRDFSAPSREISSLATYIDYLYALDQRNKTSNIGNLYQLFSTLPFVYNFFTQKKIINIVNILGNSNPTFGTVPIVRVDRPFDRKYKTYWHQDKWFSLSGPNSLTIWLPLVEMNSKIGYLEIFKKFDLNKIYKIKILDKKKYNENHAVKYNFKKKDIIKLKVNFGDIVIFNQNLVHRSGTNTSKNCRITVQARFNDLKNAKNPYSTFKSTSSTDYMIENRKSLLVY